MQHDTWVMREVVAAWLLDVRGRERECRELELRIAETRERLDGLASACGPGVAGGPARDRMAEGVAALEDMASEWAGRVAEDAALIAEAMAACTPRLPSRWACWLHWAEGLTWAEVAERTGYSEQHVRGPICDAGVAELYALAPEEFRRSSFPNAAPA